MGQQCQWLCKILQHLFSSDQGEGVTTVENILPGFSVKEMSPHDFNDYQPVVRILHVMNGVYRLRVT